jgi:hypothetical protein
MSNRAKKRVFDAGVKTGLGQCKAGRHSFNFDSLSPEQSGVPLKRFSPERVLCSLSGGECHESGRRFKVFCESPPHHSENRIKSNTSRSLNGHPYRVGSVATSPSKASRQGSEMTRILRERESLGSLLSVRKQHSLAQVSSAKDRRPDSKIADIAAPVVS